MKRTGRTFRIREDLCEQVDKIISTIGVPMSTNGAIETMLEQFLGLCDQPEGQRSIPRLVQLLEHARKGRTSGFDQPKIPENVRLPAEKKNTGK